MSRQKQIAALVARVQDGLEAARELAELVGTSEARPTLRVIEGPSPGNELDAEFARKILASKGIALPSKR
jgi:hypothetical protein